MDLPRPFVIRESTHRIHDPLSAAKLDRLGASLHLGEGQRVLDLACGSGELLCRWSRDHGVTGTGVDVSTVFLDAARRRAGELGVADAVSFVHGDASAYVADETVEVAACLGATWIAGGPLGTIDLLARSLRPGGTVLIGEPWWRVEPTPEVVRGNHQASADVFGTLEELVGSFAGHGWDVVQMVLADPDDWDAYAAEQWWNMRAWLDANPDDELWPRIRAELDTAALDHVRYRREGLGWGVFALRRG